MLCLDPKTTDKFLKALKDGSLNIGKMASGEMSSEQTRAEFAKIVGEPNAKWVNTEFEKKLTLKNQQAGIIDFIKKTGGLKPEAKADLVSEVSKLGEKLTKKQFLNDYADKKLGVHVSKEQIDTLIDLTKKIEEAKNIETSSLKTIQDILDTSDKVKGLTGKQKADIQAIKDEFEKQQKAKDAIIKERQDKRDALKEAKNKEREKIKAENAKKTEELRAQQKAEQERIKDEARDKKFSDYLEKKAEKDLEAKQLKEQEKIDRINKQIEDREERARQKELDDFDKETERLQKKAEQDLTKNTLGSLRSKLNKVFGDTIPKDVEAKIEDLKKEFENPQNQKMSGVSDEYLKAKNKLADYIAQQKPLSASRSIIENLSIIGRNNLIANPATPIKSATGQITNGIVSAVTARLANMSLRGENPELVSQANSEAWKTFRKTGYNTASMESTDDKHVLGKSEKFNAPTGEVKGGQIMKGIETIVRKTAQGSNKVVIDWMHNITFTKAYQKAFFDMANLVSSDIAKREGLTGAELKARAGEIFKDAVRIEPETKEGKIVRETAQKNSAYITGTNKTIASDFALIGKNGLNAIGQKYLNGLPLGSFIIPIATIPANLIANGIENGGVGLFTGSRDVFEGRTKMQSDDVATQYEGMTQYRKGIQTLIRTVGTLAVAFYLASKLKKDDFRTDNYGNHFVRVGNKWINTEYFSLISPALAGAMKIKENGDKSVGKDLYDYGAGLSSSLLNLPGIDEVSQIFQQGLSKYGTQFLSSRGVPAFVPAIQNNRPVNRILFGAHGIETEKQVSQDKRDSARKSAKAKADKLRAKYKK